LLKRLTAVPALALAVLTAALLVSCSQPEPRTNIVIIVLDTVRLDYTGPGGTEEPLTPELDGLAVDGTVFTRAWSNAPWTVPSHASMFTGLLPSSHKCNGRNFTFLSPEPTFAELLSESGYQTAAFFSNPWLSDKLTGMLRGFEERHVESGDGTEILTTVDQGGGRTVANVSAWLSGRSDERPFLMFVNLLEPHLPYHPPADYRQARLSDIPRDYVVTTAMAHEFNAGLLEAEDLDLERIGRLYGGDVNTADRYLGEILRLLEEHGVYEDAVVIVTSDHGENLGDHGYMDHQFGVFASLIDVPLVVRAPGLLPPGVREDPVMLTDVYDTVLDVARVETGPETPHSRSLLGPPADAARPQIAEYTGANPELVKHLRYLNPSHDTSRQEVAFAKVRVDSLEFTVGTDGSKRLYDLKNDPGRELDLAPANSAVAGALFELLPAVRHADGVEVEIDEETREWLRSLGYIR
jgi:arylsulfatase A-like enzyme